MNKPLGVLKLQMLAKAMLLQTSQLSEVPEYNRTKYHATLGQSGIAVIFCQVHSTLKCCHPSTAHASLWSMLSAFHAVRGRQQCLPSLPAWVQQYFLLQL